MAGRRKFPSCSNFPYSFTFLSFSALLSFWYLICNVEFDSDSPCLDLLSNFAIDILQKLQNLPQNAISRIIGTLMCELG